MDTAAAVLAVQGHHLVVMVVTAGVYQIKVVTLVPPPAAAVEARDMPPYFQGMAVMVQPVQSYLRYAPKPLTISMRIPSRQRVAR
jgi:hypothetical protein